MLNLKETSPESGSMLSEIFYWRDITRVLSAVSKEIKQPFVELVVQLTQDLDLVKDFFIQRDRISKGIKEAKWNNKHMK